MLWDHAFTELIGWIGAFGITGAASSAAAYGAFRWFGASWLERKFSRDLEQFKARKNEELEKLRSEYQRETERLKSDISRLLDRATRLHVREYEVLPEAWGLLNKALGAAAETIARLPTRPNLDSLSNAQFEEFLVKSNLADSQRDELRQSGEKTTLYAKMQEVSQLSQANVLVTEYNNYIILNGIFIEDYISTLMSQASQKLRRVLILREHIMQGYGEPPTWQSALADFTAAENLMNELKLLIRAKLFDTRLPIAEP